MTKQEFVDLYTNRLEQAVTEHPEDYGFPISKAPVIAFKMLKALERNSYNKESRALKMICKEMGVAYTYSAINAFFATLTN
jgi:hypothetical protein